MTIFQVVAVLFALFMMYVTSIHGKKKNLTLAEVSLWLSTWGLFAVIALFPNVLLGITGILKFSRVFDLLLVVALMVLSVLVFFTYFALKEMHHKFESLVRQLALTESPRTGQKRKK